MSYPGRDSQYIRGVHTACSQRGYCQYVSAIATLQQAQHLLDLANERKSLMELPVALWCEKPVGQEKGHSFSSKDGHVRVQRQIYDGAMKQEEFDALIYCKRHATELGLMPDPKLAITNGEDAEDAEWSSED